jgi:membrane fusion protein, macrolide-specific efflux system
MSNRVLRRLLVVLGALAVLAVVAFGPAVVSRLTKKPQPVPPLATVAVNSFPVTAKASGTLFPQQLTYVNFATSGVLAELDIKVGDAVTPGQKLAQLDQSAQLAALRAAQASLSSGEAALATANATGNTQAAAAAQAQIAGAQVQVQKAQSDLANTVLSAPQAATVLQVSSGVGQSVTAGTTRAPSLGGSAVPIVDPTVAATGASTAFIILGSATQYQVSAAFSEANAAQLVAGQTGNIVFDALPGLSLPGKVVAIANTATQVNGVPEYYASVAATATDPRLRSGMTVNVSVDIAQATSVLAVPSQAIFTLNNGLFVDVWYKGGAVQTQVTTGLIGDRLTQITSGLTSGEQVELSVGQSLPSAQPSPT